MKHYILESCVDSVESALAAAAGRSRQAGIVRKSDHRGNYPKPGLVSGNQKEF